MVWVWSLIWSGSVLMAGWQSKQWGEAEITRLVLCLLLLGGLWRSLSSSVFPGRAKFLVSLLHINTETHVSVWDLSLLCHFEFFSHLFHGLIRASDDRGMGGGGEEGESLKDRGIGLVHQELMQKWIKRLFKKYNDRTLTGLQSSQYSYT